jgi:hypothetical protein
LRKALLVCQGQADNFGLLNGSLRGLLHSTHHKISHGSALKFGGTLERCVQIKTDPGFKSSCGGWGWGHGERLLKKRFYGNMPYYIKMRVVFSTVKLQVLPTMARHL